MAKVKRKTTLAQKRAAGGAAPVSKYATKRQVSGQTDRPVANPTWRMPPKKEG